MVTPELVKYRIPVIWDNEFKTLNYVNEQFNDTVNLEYWKSLGFCNKFTGEMCDMRYQQPSWNQQIIDLFTEMGWKDIGTSYYRMMPGTILPTHNDLYKKYIELFALEGHEPSIHRAVIFLEDWQSGHYFEGQGQPLVNWSAGDTVEWKYDTPHMAANVGLTPRYTLQITGHR
jgi:hypothetical protein